MICGCGNMGSSRLVGFRSSNSEYALSGYDTPENSQIVKFGFIGGGNARALLVPTGGRCVFSAPFGISCRMGGSSATACRWWYGVWGKNIAVGREFTLLTTCFGRGLTVNGGSNGRGEGDVVLDVITLIRILTVTVISIST